MESSTYVHRSRLPGVGGVSLACSAAGILSTTHVPSGVWVWNLGVGGGVDRLAHCWVSEESDSSAVGGDRICEDPRSHRSWSPSGALGLVAWWSLLVGSIPLRAVFVP